MLLGILLVGGRLGRGIRGRASFVWGRDATHPWVERVLRCLAHDDRIIDHHVSQHRGSLWALLGLIDQTLSHHMRLFHLLLIQLYEGHRFWRDGA